MAFFSGFFSAFSCGKVNGHQNRLEPLGPRGLGSRHLRFFILAIVGGIVFRIIVLTIQFFKEIGELLRQVWRS